jgi:hypothetical protein
MPPSLSRHTRGWFDLGWRLGRFLLAGAIFLSPSLIVLCQSSGGDISISTRWLLFIVCGLSGGLLLPLHSVDRGERSLLGLLVCTGMFVLSTHMSRVVTFPFSLTWSEGNHIWAASLFFNRGQSKIIGDSLFPNYVTPGLYGLEGLPFLLPQSSIAINRFWEAVLWIVPGLLLGWVLATHYTSLNIWRRVAFSLWCFIFLSQGPVYAPLLLAGIIVVFGTIQTRVIQRATLIFFACFYAGLSRWTWMFIPSAWALILVAQDNDSRRDYVDDSPLQLKVHLSILALVSVAGGVLSQFVSTLITKRPSLVYLTSIEHSLLWYRLFPNETFKPGILLGLLLTTGPLLLWIAWSIWNKREEHSRITILFMSAILISTLVIGMVVSVKIGGGSNLHNMDMFLVTLVIFTTLALGSMGQTRVRRPISWPSSSRLLVIATIVIPILWVVSYQTRLNLPPLEVINKSLDTLKVAVADAAKDGEVLFIDQRQLLTFGSVPEIDLVMEYDLIDLMDHAMAGSGIVLEDFYKDLHNQRFKLIVSDPMPIVWKGRAYSFGEENDAWVQNITVPLLEWYQPVIELDDVGVWLLFPVSEETK